MKADPKRQVGFYWVRFEGAPVVCEYVQGFGCSEETDHWHVPGSDECYSDEQVCERLSGLIPLPDKSFSEALGEAVRDCRYGCSCHFSIRICDTCKSAPQGSELAGNSCGSSRTTEFHQRAGL